MKWIALTDASSVTRSELNQLAIVVSKVSINPIIITCLSCLFVIDAGILRAQESEPTTERSTKKKLLNVRFVALGHRRLAKFDRSKEAKVIKIKTPDGDTIEEIIPAGVPTEIMGKKFEYLPSLVYMPNKDHDTGERFSISPLTLNACSKESIITHRQRLDVYLRQSSGDKGGEQELVKYVSSPVGEHQSHMLVALVNKYNQLEGWKTPVTKSFDTSPEQLPIGSLLVFNGTPYRIEVDFMADNKMNTVTVKPLDSLKLKPTVNKEARTILRARLVALNGVKKQFYYNSLRIKKDGRSYLFAYFDPRRQTSNPAGMVQFSDEIKSPIPQPVAP
ncbi:MAG: hypothetical protein H7A51_04480 [Akkermansiaceae bacterium]|nr:hypothetical protein [Akkermansiaceae bacterium]